MPQIIAALRDFANPFSILTKGTLILRDLDLLRAGGVGDVGRPVDVDRLRRRDRSGARSSRAPRRHVAGSTPCAR